VKKCFLFLALVALLMLGSGCRATPVVPVTAVPSPVATSTALPSPLPTIAPKTVVCEIRGSVSEEMPVLLFELATVREVGDWSWRPEAYALHAVTVRDAENEEFVQEIALPAPSR
jgi:hypothetical protein